MTTYPPIELLGDGICTADIGGNLSTIEFTEEICDRLRRG
jgi:hypothetical protein